LEILLQKKLTNGVNDGHAEMVVMEICLIHGEKRLTVIRTGVEIALAQTE
jgi:hypothetical protein